MVHSDLMGDGCPGHRTESLTVSYFRLSMRPPSLGRNSPLLIGSLTKLGMVLGLCRVSGLGDENLQPQKFEAASL